MSTYSPLCCRSLPEGGILNGQGLRLTQVLGAWLTAAPLPVCVPNPCVTEGHGRSPQRGCTAAALLKISVVYSGL